MRCTHSDACDAVRALVLATGAGHVGPLRLPRAARLGRFLCGNRRTLLRASSHAEVLRVLAWQEADAEAMEGWSDAHTPIEDLFGPSA